MMTLSPMTERYAKEVCGWKYEEPYSVYNFFDWETCKENGWSIADKDGRRRDFYALTREEEGRAVLCGFLRLTNEDDGVNLGLGLRPDLCGKGLGAELMELAINKYKRRFPGLALELDVRIFNERAIKLYTRCGFEIVDRFTRQTPAGETEYLRMRYTGK